MEPCLAPERRDEIQNSEFVRSLSWPRFQEIPERAYLVLGSQPGEPRNGRDFYDDPHFYLLDNYDVFGGSKERFIKCDLEDFESVNTLQQLYCKLFDEVIFDYSVLKHAENPKVEFLLRLVKPGGRLIVATGDVQVFYSISNTVQNRERKKANKTRNIRRKFYVPPYETTIMSTEATMEMSDVARRVYRPLVELGYASASSECLVIDVSRDLFGGSRRRRRRTRRRKEASRN
jgi:hypothetical protein